MTNVKDFPFNKKIMDQQQGININPNSLPDIDCIKCGGLEFITVTRIKKLPRTISPNG